MRRELGAACAIRPDGDRKTALSAASPATETTMVSAREQTAARLSTAAIEPGCAALAASESADR
eukprot:1581075-Prymnesium_polylepis.1